MRGTSKPILSNGWVLGKEFGHLKNGLVRTSLSVQSKTDDIVLTSMNRASLGAIGAEQGYVTASRGRERGMIFTDMARDELLQAMKKKDIRISATELMSQPKAAKPKPKLHVDGDRAGKGRGCAGRGAGNGGSHPGGKK